ncbi:MAG: hypothetical protein V8S08_02480 [Lachnoclostridium sp.]
MRKKENVAMKCYDICNLFCEDGEYIIPFACIKRIGPDIILVET